MPLGQLLVGWTGTALLAVALAGLVIRRRVHLWYAFAALLLIVLTHDLLVGWWPRRFHRGPVMQIRESTLILVRLVMVVELAFRVFRGFPGAMATARGLIVVIFAGTFLAVVAIPTERRGYVGFVGELMPRVLNGTVWLFTALTGLILWYRLPIHWFQKAILLSYVPYLLVFTVTMNTLGNLGWQRARWANELGAAAYVCLSFFWVITAWRNGPARPPKPLA